MLDDNNAQEVDEPPLFKYQRLGRSVPLILGSDAASSLAVHARFLVLGTASGALHILDPSGLELRRFAPHSSAVTGVSIDASGEFVGSCSQDGTVVVSNTISGEGSTQWYPRPVQSIALMDSAGDFASRRPVATGGLAGQLVHSARGWFGGAKDTVLHAGEGPVTAVACGGPLIAWANDVGVKVFDTAHNRCVSFVERPYERPPSDLFRCQLLWSSPAELVIGWADSIKLGVVRSRGGGGPDSKGPRLYMEVVALLQTDFFVCGLATARLRREGGAWATDLLALAFEILCDSLSVEGHEALTAAQCDDLSEMTAYVVAPHDIVVARSFSWDDRIAWLLSSGRFELALTLASRHTASLSRHTPLAIAEQYAASLLEAPHAAPASCAPGSSTPAPADGGTARGGEVGGAGSAGLRAEGADSDSGSGLSQSEQGGELEAPASVAARVLASQLGNDAARWLRWLRRFAAVGAVRWLVEAVPVRPPLQGAGGSASDVYESALELLMREAPAEALAYLRSWHPSLWREPVLALLAVSRREVGVALDLLLSLPAGQADVFVFLSQQGAHALALHRLLDLARLSWPRTLALLLARSDSSFPPAAVVPQLEAAPCEPPALWLHEYLHGLLECNPAAAAPFAPRQVELYAALAPQQLLPFLRSSSGYEPEAALDVAKEHGLVDAQIYLLAQQGAARAALSLALGDGRDLGAALKLVTESGEEELWPLLLDEAVASPALTQELLLRVCRPPLLAIDPLALLRRLPEGERIDGLRKHLTRLLRQVAEHEGLSRGAAAIAHADTAALLGERHAAQCRGTTLHLPLPQDPSASGEAGPD
ncbi:vacuolar protein sorting 41 [Emiliania huxleyi CCMP1516]|uniref:Vps41 beta-propeller domain-containing protein n=5 Tax=Emiliania huxleyi TaxID=2903 RepID=A0A0D3J1V4_EMIH1|nr:vacuolar protein sorting 41 [Emiliania huxleyi CCMP1516]EOD17489.1 vacuolar protein sorting 41 [Emiliania huxleyi CCMP1516]|eukprot:XP_005769918.1 vacuolar protein sorting 41 [Emiliania huxleyi CCMP1516]